MQNEEQLLDFISGLFKQHRDVIVGPGDDCAVISYTQNEYLLLTVDQLISDVHYVAGKTPVELIAKKLLNRNISDIAAMGGYPCHALVSICGNYESPVYGGDWLRGFFKSLSLEAEKYSLSICGGDIASLSSNGQDTRMVFSLTLVGKVKREKLCLRSNLKTGDLIFVTGEIGNSFGTQHHLKFSPRLKEAQFLAGTYTNTIIDISDGLVKDLYRIAKASQTSVSLDLTKVPLRGNINPKKAVTDGEDYELLFGISPDKADILFKSWPFKNVNLTKIGYAFISDCEATVIDSSTGKPLASQLHSGYDHLAKSC